MHSQRGENISVSLYQQSKIITQLVWCLVRERLGWFEAPQGLASVRRNPLMLQSEMMQSSTWCRSASVQTSRGRLNKQWPNQININAFPCKVKTNGPEEHFHSDAKHWYCGEESPAIKSSENAPIQRKTMVEWVTVRWQTQHWPKKGSKDSECCYWVLWTDMKSIWKSSEIFPLISVEAHSKARRQHEKNYWIQTVWTLVCPRRTDKRSFDPKQKLNKGSKCTMIKEVTTLGRF